MHVFLKISRLSSNKFKVFINKLSFIFKGGAIKIFYLILKQKILFSNKILDTEICYSKVVC